MEIVSLTSQLHFLRLPVGHAYLWQGDDGLTLIDCGVPGSAALIDQAIRDLGRDRSELRRLILTHFHFDHVGAAAEIADWAGVSVFAHRDDAPFIRGDRPGPPPDLLDWERPIFDQVQAQLADVPPADPVRVDHELSDGDVIDFGGARAVAAPGHTPWQSCDPSGWPAGAVRGRRRGARGRRRVMLGVFNTDPSQALDSFGRLAELETEIACFGHGEPLTEGAAAALRSAYSQARSG